MLSGLRDHRNAFPVVARHIPEQCRIAVRLKSHTFADLKVEHCECLRSWLKNRKRYDPVIQIDQVRFAEIVDVDLCLRFVAPLRLKLCAGQDGPPRSISPC